jgi:hypothetical protein
MTPLILALAIAAAPSHGAPSEHPHNMLGLKMVAAATPSPEGVEVLGGPGLVLEREVLPGVELELDVIGLFSPEHTEIPVDVLVKHAFHVTRSLDLFLGAGPSASLGFDHGERHFHAGLLTSAGAYVWLAHDVGLILEVDYGLYADPLGPLQEAELSTGVAMRF